MPFALDFGLSLAYEATRSTQINRIVNTISSVWVFITTGLVINTFPGSIDDKDAVNAFLESIAKAKIYPKRVYGTILAYGIILTIIFAPIGLWALLDGGDPLWIAVYAPVMGLFTVLVLSPMFFISFSRMYADIEGNPVHGE